MRKTPSPQSRQLVVGIALLLVGVAMRILAFKEIPSTYHIKGLVTSGVYAKT
jgi:uncharacterized membrane protein HdeD (DUF308 family)